MMDLLSHCGSRPSQSQGGSGLPRRRWRTYPGVGAPHYVPGRLLCQVVFGRFYPSARAPRGRLSGAANSAQKGSIAGDVGRSKDKKVLDTMTDTELSTDAILQ